MEKTIPEGQMLAYTMAGATDSSLIIATHGVTDNSYRSSRYDMHD